MLQEPAEALALVNDRVSFRVTRPEGAWQLEDRRAGVAWGCAAGKTWVVVGEGEERLSLGLLRAEMVEDGIRCRLGKPDGSESQLSMVFRLSGEALRVYLVPNGRDCPVMEVFPAGLAASAAEAGEAVLPIRLGLLVPAQGSQPFELRLGTYEYEGLHMAMAGLCRAGAALLVTWQDPYIHLNISRRMEDGPRLALSLGLAKTARSFELHCLGKGDYHTLAAAYRAQAEALEYRQPWSRKPAERPQAERLFGACNIKLWTALAREVDAQMVEQSVTVHWTFDEAAQIAEHLKRDVQLNDVLFHLGGWSTYGYDCRHPDIMPANPECGGDAGLADCARRVQDCGYLFCLHDNYQDMYRDAPSWGEEWIQKQADGSLQKGGVWLGGQAYYTCAREALKLAQRPQNLERVRQVAHPDLYFIDTTYAVGPQECFDPRHPLTRQDDIRWKQALSDYARDVFGMFGSECGREWAVAHADFFEGLTSVSGRYYHIFKPEELDVRVIPLFEMVFHDCIAMYGKYGYQPGEMAEQVIHHAAIGRPLYYHSLGNHLYWQDPDACRELPPADGGPDPALYTRAHGGWAEGMCLWDRFMKNTQEILGPLNRITSQDLLERYDFLDDERRVRRARFTGGMVVVANGSAQNVTVPSRLGGEVVLPPFGLLAEAGPFTAFVARSWGGRVYDQPVLFTLTQLDGGSLGQPGQVRVFHGFGDPVLRWQGKEYCVEREAVIPALEKE